MPTKQKRQALVTNRNIDAVIAELIERGYMVMPSEEFAEQMDDEKQAAFKEFKLAYEHHARLLVAKHQTIVSRAKAAGIAL